VLPVDGGDGYAPDSDSKNGGHVYVRRCLDLTVVPSRDRMMNRCATRRIGAS